MPFAAGKVKKTNVFLSEIREGLRDRERSPFFGFGLFRIHPCASRIKLVHHAVGVCFPPVTWMSPPSSDCFWLCCSPPRISLYSLPKKNTMLPLRRKGDEPETCRATCGFCEKGQKDRVTAVTPAPACAGINSSRSPEKDADTGFPPSRE